MSDVTDSCKRPGDRLRPSLMKRIVALLLLVVGVAHAADSRRRAVGKPSGAAGALQVANFIDMHIGAKLTGAGIAPAAIAKDEEFLRRVTVDLTATIPSAADVDAF